jgi:hypothetical protein
MVVTYGVGAVAAQGAHYVRGRQIPEVRLRNGAVLRDVTVVAVGATTIIARWEGGKGTILLTQLPDEMRADLAPAEVKPPPAVAPAPGVAAVPLDPKLATAELPTEIKLTNGFVMHKSRVTRWDTNAVLISYQGGIVSVRLKNIAPEQRVIFEARKDEALARQAKEDANSSVGQSAASQDENARQAGEAAAREEAEKRAEEISNGLSFHYLVKGMTKQQVIQAYGRPPNDSGDTFFYVLRGHDKYGNAADRLLVFKDGLLASWRDQREGEPNGAVEH